MLVFDLARCSSNVLTDSRILGIPLAYGFLSVHTKFPLRDISFLITVKSLMRWHLHQCYPISLCQFASNLKEFQKMCILSKIFQFSYYLSFSNDKIHMPLKFYILIYQFRISVNECFYDTFINSFIQQKFGTIKFKSVKFEKYKMKLSFLNNCNIIFQHKAIL